MKRLLAALAFLAATIPAHAGTDAEVRATYHAFVAAQNARDPVRIGAFFIDGPEFLWVSDGRSVWGRDAVLARMAGFQKAPVWRVEPDLEAARVIELAPESALLHLPLALVIGPAEAANRLEFLVSIQFVNRAGDWKIAALLTTARLQ